MTVDDLFMKIGQLVVENDLLRQKVSQLQSLLESEDVNKVNPEEEPKDE